MISIDRAAMGPHARTGARRCGACRARRSSRMSRSAYGARTTCESCLSVDVGRLHREGRLLPGQSFTAWTRDGKPASGIGVLIERDSVILTFSWRGPGSSEWRSVEQRVPIVWTNCHLGGRRPWFQCTASAGGRHCGRRVARLFLGGSPVFACRHCYGLAYASQQEIPRDRAISRAQKIRQRLGGSLSLDDPFPKKPLGMHWCTYERLLRKAIAAEKRSNALMLQWLHHRPTGNYR